MTTDYMFDKETIDKFVGEVRSSIESSDIEEKKRELIDIFSCIDNTTLSGDDTNSKVFEFCRKTKNYVICNEETAVNVASVCVYPPFVALAKRELNGTGIGVASVAGGFPSGQTPASVKVEEVKFALDNGADEIDFVINRGYFLEGNTDAVYDEIAAVRELCGSSARLKVILETGELGSAENIYRASMVALEAGADFIKTSTGKIAVGATPEAAYAMLLALSQYQRKSKKIVGFKVSGGVSDPISALLYYKMTKKMIDYRAVEKHNFRIGTSSLVTRLMQFLTI